MTKINESKDSLVKLKNNFILQTPTKPQSKLKRRWKYAKSDLIRKCFICDSGLVVKYILPRQKYSQKNNWSYWTGKETFKDKYLCDSCLVKIHQGGIINWVDSLEKADIFYTYLSRKTFHHNSKRN